MEMYQSCSAGSGTSHTDAKNGIGPQLGFVGGTIERPHEIVNIPELRLDIKPFIDDRWTNDLIHIADSGMDALSLVDIFHVVAQFGSLGCSS